MLANIVHHAGPNLSEFTPHMRSILIVAALIATVEADLGQLSATRLG